VSKTTDRGDGETIQSGPPPENVKKRGAAQHVANWRKKQKRICLKTGEKKKGKKNSIHYGKEGSGNSNPLRLLP